MTDASDVDLVLNMDVAGDLGLVFPADIIAKAGTIIKDGKASTP
jgi:hypothetical protein